jgi:OOP family OmpA-OmpF porin
MGSRINSDAVIQRRRNFIMTTRLNLPLLALCAALAGAASLPARAEGLYAGGELGSPGYQDNVNGVSGSGSGLSGKVYGGYQLNPNVAVEAGAMDLGHVDEAAGKVKGQGLFVDVVGSVPIAQDWSVLGRVGAARANLETSNGDDHGAGLDYGAGLQYQLNPNVALRGEWENYRVSVFDEHPNIHQYLFGVKLGF